MQNKVYTLVHKGFKSDNFIAMFEKYGIGTVIDLRSLPYARHTSRNPASIRKKCFAYSIYREDLLNTSLSKFFTLELLEAKYLGQFDIFDSKGFSDSVLFQRALIYSLKLLKKTSVLFLCSESDPLMCNRTLFFSEHLRDYGYEVVHLTSRGVQDQSYAYMQTLTADSKLKILSRLYRQRLSIIDSYIKLNNNLIYTKLPNLSSELPHD